MARPVLFLIAALTVGMNQSPLISGPLEEAGGSDQQAPGIDQYVVYSSDPAVNRASQLLNSSQPSQALELLQSAVQRHPRDPGVLMLTGLAAYRSDQVRAALGYWRRSLDLEPSDALRAIYADARREAAADRSNEKLYSAHIALRYEGSALPADAARSILATLEEDYMRISAQIGCAPSERIVAIVQSREQYLRATSAAEWSGGHYDGRIHVALPGVALPGEPDTGPRMQRALAHELVHACLTGLAPGSNPWPIWLQEGLAQKLSGDTLPPSVREQLRQLAVTRAIPRLEDLGVAWFTMSRQDAVAAYNLSLAAADALYANYAAYGIRRLLSDPEAFPRITAELDEKLGL
jgi:tetratricopeptide (TPR) repeat protein